MSLLFYDAVTKYTNATEALQVWDSVGTSMTVSTAFHPYPGQHSVSFNDCDAVGQMAVVELGSTFTEIRFGFWRYLKDSNYPHFSVAFTHLNSPQAQVRCISGSPQYYLAQGQYTSGYVYLGSLGVAQSVGSWVWYEFHLGFSTSTGFGHARVNGRAAGSVTGVDTLQVSTQVGVTQMKFQGSSNPTKDYYQSIMVWSCEGTWPADEWIGPQCLTELLPNGDGTHTDFTLSAGSSGWSLIDGVTLSTSDYISSTSTGNQSSFDVTAYSSIAGGTINAVASEFWGANIGGGSTKLAAGLIDASTQEYKTAEDVGSGRRVAGFFPTRPGSTTAWSSTDLAALEIAVRHG